MIDRIVPILRKAALWVDERLYISSVFEATAGHAIPKSSASWFYVFGSATLLCLMIQLLTGTLLSLVYVPSGGQAFTTLHYLNYEQPLGWMIRAIHNYGSLFMVWIMAIHMTQVFLWGAYKHPRELTWCSGVLLLFLTLGMAFTGQVLRFDQDAYWGIGIGVAITGRTPVIGEQAIQLLLGGGLIGGETLNRFFTLHVFIIPGTLLALISMHLRLVLTKGISEYPKPGHVVRKETYDQEYAQIIRKEGVPFFPHGVGKDLVAGAFVIFGILACALILGPKGPEGPPDPSYIDTLPRPDFPFLWIFAVAALLPDYLETPVLLGGPVIIAFILFAVPFINNTGERSWRRRPIAVLITVFVWLSLSALTYWGITSPWSPQMTAWSSDPIPAVALKDKSPLEIQGATIIQYQQCRNCHAIDGVGGERGPDLGDVGSRLTHSQLVRQVIQGSGNMPAYGKNLTPAEVDAVVAYMVSLRPEGVPAARDSSIPGIPGEEKTLAKEPLASAH